MNTFVGSTGSRTSRLAIIGEAPAKQELLEGIPFVGASGKLLWRLLERLGVQRTDCYCTNVIKTSVKPNPLTSLPYNELESWRLSVRAELTHSEANLFLALGATALWALTDEPHRITDWRGSIIPAWNGRKLIAALHPANILRQPENLHLLQRDLQLAVVQSLTPEIPAEPEEYALFPSVIDCLQHINAARASSEIAFDIETASGGIITCISIAYGSTHTSLCIPMHGLKYWNTNDFPVVYKALQALLGDTTVNKIGQNVSYDIIGLRACGIEVKPPIEDIMHMHHAIDPLAPHSLAFQASMFTNKQFWKEWDIAPGVPLANKLEEHFDYNCRDSDGTLELKRTYAQRYPKAMQFYNQRYKNLLPHLLQMYEDGLVIDKTLSLELATQMRATASRMEQVIATGFNVPNFNVNSHTQLKHVLYDTLNLPRQFNRDKFHKLVLTTDDEALIDIYLETNNPLVLGIRDAKEQYKFASFLDPKSKDAKAKRATWDGRIRTEYKLTTDTGRLSSSASTATHKGINLQQIPLIVRQVIIPAPGCIFLEPDYSQAQARVVAWDSLDYGMMHLFELARQDPTTYDIHWYNAELIMEKPRNLLQPEDRNCCKHVVYGSYFDMRGQKLQKTVLKYTDPPLFIELSECNRRQAVFKSKVPRFQERQDRIAHEVLTTGKQVSPSGRVVTYHEVIYDDLKYCFGRRDYSEILRSAYSMIPQDIEALMMNRSLEAIDDQLRAASLGRVAMQVHDSLLLEVPDTYAAVEQAFLIAQSEMERSFNIRGEEMVIPAEFKIGYHWPCGQKGCQVEESKIRTLDQLETAYRRIKQ